MDGVTVTVVTSTIGRPELRKCIESVRDQTHPCRHIVFVNGPGFHAPAREVLKDFPDVSSIYLPEDTGDYGVGPSMAGVFAAAPFLTRSDWIFYLDDDNFYDPFHVESILELAGKHDLSWAYSLRRFVDKAGDPICDDDWCSLGHQPPLWSGELNLVDNSCYAIRRTLAQRVALAWTAAPIIADRCVFMALKESGARSGCTGWSTVNYRVGLGTAPDDRAMYLRGAAKIRAEIPDGFPWRTTRVFQV